MLNSLFHAGAGDDPKLVLRVDLAPIRVASLSGSRNRQDQEGKGAGFVRTIGRKLLHEGRDIAAPHRLVWCALWRARNEMFHHVFACRVRTIAAKTLRHGEAD